MLQTSTLISESDWSGYRILASLELVCCNVENVDLMSLCCLNSCRLLERDFSKNSILGHTKVALDIIGTPTPGHLCMMRTRSHRMHS